MRTHFESEEDVRTYMSEQIVSTSEVMELLGVSRQRVNQLVQEGKLAVFKETQRVKLFLLEDIQAYQSRQK